MPSTTACRADLALLATVGSTAPFVGLFGTVWGIYHALTAIGIAGQASIDKVAGPVGEALIAFQKGIENGSLKYPEDAKLHLGLAYLQAGDLEKAKQTLNSVAGADGSQALARLWLVEAGVK